jgi:hypothetical protein
LITEIFLQYYFNFNRDWVCAHLADASQMSAYSQIKTRIIRGDSLVQHAEDILSGLQSGKYTVKQKDSLLMRANLIFGVQLELHQEEEINSLSRNVNNLGV